MSEKVPTLEQALRAVEDGSILRRGNCFGHQLVLAAALRECIERRADRGAVANGEQIENFRADILAPDADDVPVDVRSSIEAGLTA